MATTRLGKKKGPGKGVGKKQRKIQKVQTQFAALVVEQYGLPRGAVVALLKKHKIDSAVIKEVASRLIPYTYTGP